MKKLLLKLNQWDLDSMNNYYARLKKRQFKVNKAIAIDVDLSKRSYNINLNEESLNQARVVRKNKKTNEHLGAGYWLGVLGEKDIKP